MLSCVVVGYSLYSRLLRRDIESEGRSLSRTAGEFLISSGFAAKITEYLDNQVLSDVYVTDSNYMSNLEMIRTLSDSANINSLYVVRYIPDDKLGGGRIYYVLDGGAEQKFSLGSFKPYESKATLEAMRNGSPVTPYSTAGKQGGSSYFTVYEPLVLPSGETVAYIGADFSMAEINSQRTSFLITIIAFTVSVGTIMSIISLILIHTTVTAPIRLTVHAINDFLVSDAKHTRIESTSIAKLRIKTGDELEMLANALKRMTIKIGGYVEALDDSTDLEYDSLTSLLTASSFRRSVQLRLIDQAAKSESANQDALFLIDIDDFTKLNAAGGTMFGDTILQNLSRIVAEACPENALVSRVGGDEFAIFAYSIGDDDAILRRAQRITNAVSVIAPEIIHDQSGTAVPSDRITVSIGIAIARKNGIRFDDLFAAADEALDSVKKTNPGGFALYDA